MVKKTAFVACCVAVLFAAVAALNACRYGENKDEASSHKTKMDAPISPDASSPSITREELMELRRRRTPEKTPTPTPPPATSRPSFMGGFPAETAYR